MGGAVHRHPPSPGVALTRTPFDACPLSRRRHPPPVPPGGELGSHLAMLSVDLQHQDPRFPPPVRENGPVGPRTSSIVSTSRGPLAPPLPRELRRHSRASASPAVRPPPRGNGVGRARRIRSLRPTNAFDRPLPTRQEPRRPAPRSFLELRLAAALEGADPVHAGLPASVSRPMPRRYFLRSGWLDSTSDAPSPGALSAARRAADEDFPA